MKDRLSIIVGIVIAAVLVVVLVIVVVVANSSYKTKSSEMKDQIASVQEEVDAIKSTKDNNNFTPEELVKAFLAEVKADSAAKEKLYLSSSAQNMDVKNTLKLGNDLANLTVGESEQSVESESAEVAINLEVASNQVARTFNLIKEDGVWKINGVVAE